jgi:hypothetical protein
VAISRFHEEAVKIAVEYPDMRHPLDPRIARASGNDQPQREAVLQGKRLAVHLVYEQSIRVERLLDRNRALEFRHRSYGRVGPGKQNVLGARVYARSLKQVSQADPGPLRVPDRAVFPLNPRHRGLEQAPAVTRAFEHARQFDPRHLLDLGEAQRKRAPDLAV